METFPCFLRILQTHCFSEKDCGEDENCYQSLPGCHLADMSGANASSPIPDEASTDPTQASWITFWMNYPNDSANFRFCGDSRSDAINNCSMDRHCPDFQCSDGLRCFENLSHVGSSQCNAYELINMTPTPTTENPSKVSLILEKS